MHKAFIITIDTEGDNLWTVKDIRQRITTKNARYLFRFQELCEKYGFIPTYLTNYEMAKEEAMKELAGYGLKKGNLEIGAHEHAWNQPPYFPLIKHPVKRELPYLNEYPRFLIREKLRCLTNTLEDVFQHRITSHRGGRWCLNRMIAEELIELGYIVDCTCTPGVSWRDDPGWSVFSHGTDWTRCRNRPFYINVDHDRITRRLLEIPMSIFDLRGTGHLSWLRPNLTNRTEMLEIIKYISDSNYGFAEFMLHSSELMPGGSPTFNNNGKIEKLYQDIDEVFSFANSLGYRGMSLSDYAMRLVCCRRVES